MGNDLNDIHISI